jgi:hypothetical protein
MTHDQRHIKETREMFQKAGMIFTDGGHELQVQRKHYSLRLTESYTCGLGVEMKAMQRIKFSTHQLLERDLTILDNLCEVHHLLASLQPHWCTTQTMLLFGKKPGDPLLLFHCGNHSDKPIGVYDRPASVSSVHKRQPVHEFPASATPKEIADYLRNKHAAVQPAVSWEDFVDQWNLQHSARLGVPTLMRAVLHLFLGRGAVPARWQASFYGSLPAHQLVELPQSTDIVGKHPADCQGGRVKPGDPR